MPQCEIIAVGTELLLGQLADTNTAYIAGCLADNGIDVYATHAIGDNRTRIAEAIRGVLQRADGAITCGGLGPTIDDVTKEAICDALDLEVEPNQAALRAMEAVFSASGREMRDNNRKQALLPADSVPLENPSGTAPGFVAFAADGKFVAALPGVPHEMKPMLDERLVPWLRSHFAVDSVITTRILHTIGIAESEIDHRIGDLFASQENPKIAVLAHDFRCDVKLMAKAGTAQAAEALIAPLEATIAARLQGYVFGTDAQTLEGVIVQRLSASGQTVAVAESCTGGRIAARLTSVPGASQTFVGGVVAYDNGVKSSELGVPARQIDEFGAVSEEVAISMARGARERLRASIALSTTGIAGPEGGTAEKPVGLVWFALAGPAGVQTQRMHFRGTRELVQARATVAGLGLLLKAS